MASRTPQSSCLLTSPIRYRSNLTADFGNKTPPDVFWDIEKAVNLSNGKYWFKLSENHNDSNIEVISIYYNS